MPSDPTDTAPPAAPADPPALAARLRVLQTYRDHGRAAFGYIVTAEGSAAFVVVDWVRERA